MSVTGSPRHRRRSNQKTTMGGQSVCEGGIFHSTTQETGDKKPTALPTDLLFLILLSST